MAGLSKATRFSKSERSNGANATVLYESTVIPSRGEVDPKNWTTVEIMRPTWKWQFLEVMTMASPRRKFSASFKAKVALAAMKKGIPP
jgi:hypothetical protein